MADDRPDKQESHPDSGDGALGGPPGQGRKSGRPDAPGGGGVDGEGIAGPAADIGPILEAWPVGGNRPTVRLVRTASGERVIQVRLELGILQMAIDGRPDGRRPHGADSFLEWHASRLELHRAGQGSDDGFVIASKDCEALREEGVQVYHRYVALFALEEYECVVRDTIRNLRMFDLCRDFGASQGDRTVLEQYRPFVVMMRARAEAAIGLGKQSDGHRVLTDIGTDGDRLAASSFDLADDFFFDHGFYGNPFGLGQRRNGRIP
jgi:hypothetical protein